MLILLIVLPDQLVITSVSKLLFTHIIDISNLELMLCGPDHTKGPSSIMVRPLASRSGGLGFGSQACFVMSPTFLVNG